MLIRKKSLTAITQECREEYLTPITKTIKIRWTRHTGLYWGSKEELKSDILQWTPSHGWAKAGRPARSCIQQLCADTGRSLDYLPGAMDDREGWRERVREIRAGGVTWWWRIRILISFLDSPCRRRVEYADCISHWEVRSHKNVCSGYDTLKIWVSWITSLLRRFWHWEVVLIRVPSMGQINLFRNYLYSIGPRVKTI